MRHGRLGFGKTQVHPVLVPHISIFIAKNRGLPFPLEAVPRDCRVYRGRLVVVSVLNRGRRHWGTAIAGEPSNLALPGGDLLLPLLLAQLTRVAFAAGFVGLWTASHGLNRRAHTANCA
jgi:hypothetical protein